MPEEAEYYDVDRPDRQQENRLSQDYVESYQVNLRKAKENKQPLDVYNYFTPRLYNYSLSPEFYNPFRSLPDVRCFATCRNNSFFRNT